MKSCFETFLHTTDPRNGYLSLVDFDVFLSIIAHAIFYCILFVVLCRVVSIKSPYKCRNIFCILIGVMIVGYIARLYRSKTIYRVFLENQYSNEDALEETRRYMKTGYFTFYFLS